jgi:hypothetical protein
MKEPRPTQQAGSRKESVQPGTSPEPAPTRAVLKDISSRDDGLSREAVYAFLGSLRRTSEQCLAERYGWGC